MFAGHLQTYCRRIPNNHNKPRPCTSRKLLNLQCERLRCKICCTLAVDVVVVHLNYYHKWLTGVVLAICVADFMQSLLSGPPVPPFLLSFFGLREPSSAWYVILGHSPYIYSVVTCTHKHTLRDTHNNVLVVTQKTPGRVMTSKGWTANCVSIDTRTFAAIRGGSQMSSRHRVAHLAS